MFVVEVEIVDDVVDVVVDVNIVMVLVVVANVDRWCVDIVVNM